MLEVSAKAGKQGKGKPCSLSLPLSTSFFYCCLLSQVLIGLDQAEHWISSFRTCFTHAMTIASLRKHLLLIALAKVL